MLSNQDLINKIKQEHKSSVISNGTFPTAIIELPSKGILYEQSNPLSSGKVEMRYMNYKAEEILTDTTYIQQGIAYDKLCEYLIISNGEGEIIDYNTLTLFDRDAIFVAARILGKGTHLTNTISCKNVMCNHTQVVDVDLSNLDTYEYDFSQDLDNPNSNLFTYELEIDDGVKDEIKIKMLTVADEKIIREKSNSGLTDRTLRLIYRIHSVNGFVDRNDIKKYVTENLLTIHSEELRKYINKVNKSFKLTYKSKCSRCEEVYTYPVTIGLDFFRLQP